MSQERYFVFLYPEDRRLRDLLDLAVYILNPQEKWPAHITLAGPYNKRANSPRQTRLRSKISTFGVGEFRSESQNTVFLNVGGDGIKDFWHKPDYAHARVTPHLTLYDGSSSYLADMVRDALKDIRIFFFFYVSQVEIVQSIRGQTSKKLEAVVNFKALSHTATFTPDIVKSMKDDDRIFYASEALRKAKYYMSLDHAN